MKFLFRIVKCITVTATFIFDVAVTTTVSCRVNKIKSYVCYLGYLLRRYSDVEEY